MLPLRNFTPLWKKLLELRFKGFVRAAGIQLLGLPGVRESLRRLCLHGLKTRRSLVRIGDHGQQLAAGGRVGCLVSSLSTCVELQA